MKAASLLRSLIVFISILFCAIHTVAQESVKVHVQGISISTNLSPIQAKHEALKDAKYKALIKAGISENINRSSILMQNENKESISELFNELISTNVNGEVILDSIISEQKTFNEYGNMELKLDILATVYKTSSKNDCSFFIKVKGVKERYCKAGLLSFSVTPSQDGYLYIFNINESEATLIYPYSDKATGIKDNVQKFIQKQEILFPIHPAFKPGYELVLPNNKTKEVNRLLFVFTKKEVPFIGNENIKDIYSWLAIIPQYSKSTIIKEFVIETI